MAIAVTQGAMFFGRYKNKTRAPGCTGYHKLLFQAAV
jgi:hypothetical protein